MDKENRKSLTSSIGDLTVFDLIIKNGTIIDGTGRLRYQDDIGINGDKIESIGRLKDVQSNRCIDAENLIIAPGFIDMHSHSDMSMFNDPGGESKVFQGVTTEVTGNCSYSPFPISPTLGANFGMSMLDFPTEWRWTDLDGWATQLESTGISINIAPQLGQAALQMASGAIEDRPATEDQMKEMQRLAIESIEQGAFSLSTGLSLSPSSYMSTEEIIKICQSISQFEGVFYATHARVGAGRHLLAIEEAIEIGLKGNIPVEFSHLAIGGQPDMGGWRNETVSPVGRGPDMMELFENARESGLDITYDCYPYTAGQAGIDQAVPNWAQAGGIDAYMDRLLDSSTREKIRDEVRAGIGGVKPMWNTWIISDVDSDASKSLVGRSIANIAVDRGVEPAEAALQLEYEERGEVSAVVHNRLERDVRFFLSHPLGMIGSDGNAISPTGKKSEEKLHPRFYGTYPRILGKYVREESLLSLETAVSKMTSLPAKRLPLKNRGRLEEGLIADIAIFNPDTIIDKATFEDPHQLAIGMHYVLVAGNLVIDNGKHTGASPGKVLRRNK